MLELLPSELPLPEIADELFLSVNTVKSHVRRLYRRLGVGSRADAVARACDRGLLERRALSAVPSTGPPLRTLVDDAVETALRSAPSASHRRRAVQPGEPPTDAELRVLRRLESDLSLPQIATQLYLSVNTVKSHTRRLYARLEVSSRGEAVTRARRRGLL